MTHRATETLYDRLVKIRDKQEEVQIEIDRVLKEFRMRTNEVRVEVRHARDNGRSQ